LKPGPPRNDGFFQADAPPKIGTIPATLKFYGKLAWEYAKANGFNIVSKDANREGFFSDFSLH
jgi:hypothetical protein